MPTSSTIDPAIVRGVELFNQMIAALGDEEASNRCVLESKWWGGQPFRNIVAETLGYAQQAGAQAQAAFLTCLTDYVTSVVIGSIPGEDFSHNRRAMRGIAKAVTSAAGQMMGAA